MARDHARVNVTIWGDPDFRALPAPAQHLYLTLWTAPKLSYCGVHDWRPGRIAARSTGLTADDVETIAQCLEARHFFVIDRDTEECLIRSWVKFDGLMKQPRMAVSCIKAYADIESDVIRGVLVDELRKVRTESPELACWGDSRVQEVLDHDTLSAKGLPVPSDPFGDGFTPGFGLSLAQSRDGVSTGVSTPPTPAPAPAPYSCSSGLPAEVGQEKPRSASRKRPAKPLPEDWKPTETHRSTAETRGIDLEREAEQFRLHAEANDRRQVNWNAAFSQWLNNARGGIATKAPTPAAPRLVARQCDSPEPHPGHRWEWYRNHFNCEGVQP